MTRSRDTDPIPEMELDALLREAQAHPPMPDTSFLDRIAAEGRAVQAEAAAGDAAPNVVPLQRSRSKPARGGWTLAPLTALAASLVLGIGLGAGFAPELSTLSADLLSNEATTETVMWSFDMALEEGV
ncbi:hypothetical protein [Dinoroseobacter sp. S76]|uniref:hypothetical protein n=1 Tax=Dinoroseobacter sp. S76 TaxID=3415124 RepID=UPI003C7B65EC